MDLGVDLGILGDILDVRVASILEVGFREDSAEDPELRAPCPVRVESGFLAVLSISQQSAGR